MDDGTVHRRIPLPAHINVVLFIVFIRQTIMSPPKSKIGGEKQNMSKEMEMHLSSLGITSTTQNQAYGAYVIYPYNIYIYTFSISSLFFL